MTRINLLKVKYLPTILEPGVLYVSEEFEVAGHLCPCGCDNKIITPLGPTDWTFTAFNNKPTLYPSIGNWQIPCRSHYWISKGEIKWSYQWTEEQIFAGRQAEEELRNVYYKKLARKRNRKSIAKNIVNWLRKK
ncbi:MAG: hypothetical protein IPL31_10520 [Saprospiraceae bacterium]|nr:hypothetical protein [Saprospiraceae bacterium]